MGRSVREEARALAERGRRHAEGFTTRRTMQTLYELAGGEAGP